MMFKQISEIFNEINLVYTRLCLFYEKLEDHLDREKSKEIMEYAKTKNRIFGEMLKYYQKAGNEEVLKSWIQFTPEYHQGNSINISGLNQNLSIDELNKIVIEKEKWLTDFYEYIVQTTPSSKVKEVFQNILDRQKEDLKHLTASVKMLHDM